MDPRLEQKLHINRRQFFGKCATGIGTAALASILSAEASASAGVDPLIEKLTHFAPKAKRVIYLFQSGAPSQLDLFDHKPQMDKLFDQDLPDSVRMGQRLTGMTSGQARFPVAPSIFKFTKHGQSGQEISELLPHIATCADDICMIRSLHTTQFNHHPGQLMMQCGDPHFGLPTVGSWVTYGLGSENQDLPGFVVMAAADEAELMHMVATAARIDDRPSALRYPRGEGVGVELPERGVPLEIGKGRVVREGTAVAILSFGARLAECLKAAEELAARGLSTTVADARFAKPLDTDLVRRLAQDHEVMITIEEGSIGGFAAHVFQFLATEGLLDNGLKIRPMTLPDRFIAHGTPQGMYEDAGLTVADIVNTALATLGSNSAMADLRA